MERYTIKENVVCGGPALKVLEEMSFGKYVLDKLKQFCHSGDRVCLINGITGHEETYTTLLKEIINFAVGLEQKMNVKKGDVIAVWSVNGTEFLTAVIGILCAGATVTTLHASYKKDDIIHALSISHPKIIIGSETLLSRGLDIFNSSLEVEKIIQLNGMPLDSDVVMYKDVMVDTDIWEYEPCEVFGQSDLAIISYSSGTTGLPKGVMLTHRNILYGVTIISETEDFELLKVLSVLPWNHVYGLLTTLGSLTSNKTVIYHSEYNTVTFLNSIQEFKVNIIFAVPPIITFLAKSGKTNMYDLSSVHTIRSTTAPLNMDISKSLMNCLPNCKGIFQGFGMTETAVTVLKEDESLSVTGKPGCCGYPLPGIEAKVVNIETREILGIDQEGEVCIRGPTVMKGYLHNETATRETIDHDGYLRTGDIGYYDSHGCFFIVDRLKELIKYKGYQVPPAVIEAILLQYEGIEDCGVVGAPDDIAGELPTAFVVLKVGYNLTEAELLHFTDERLSPIYRLRGGIIFVDEIPRNLSGKLLRKELRRILQEIRKK